VTFSQGLVSLKKSITRVISGCWSFFLGFGCHDTLCNWFLSWFGDGDVFRRNFSHDLATAMSFTGFSLTTLAAMSFAGISHTTWRRCLSQDRVTKFDTLFPTFTIIANIAYLHFFSPFILFQDFYLLCQPPRLLHHVQKKSKRQRKGNHSASLCKRYNVTRNWKAAEAGCWSNQMLVQTNGFQ